MKRKTAALSLGSILMAATALPALADEAQQVSYPVAFGPVNPAAGPAGMGIPVGKFAALINYRYIETEGLYHGDDKLNENVELTKNVGIVKFRYGIAQGLDIRTATPLYTIKNENHITGTDRTMDGVGDSGVVLHKVVMDKKAGAPLNVAFDLGAVLPTATVDSNTVDSVGNRAWGGVVGVAGTWFYGANRIDQEVNVAIFTEGQHDYKKPLRFRSLTTWAYALNDTFDAGIESTFEYNDEAEYDGVKQDDAYKEWYAGPKAAWKMKNIGTNVGLGLMLPVYRDYDGVQASDGFRIEVKLVKIF